ncbi:MAG: UvrB/UvrC motif-containing protein, partial [Anaerolineae bacterium]|nr:UvrB/UvrC motif-containing protein [Anaerolineae bacterium]
TDSMRRAIDETNRRRSVQADYNEEHGIEPTAIVKQVRDLTDRVRSMIHEEQKAEVVGEGVSLNSLPRDEMQRMIKELEKEMKASAQALEFEKAAVLRDQIMELRGALIDKETEENLLVN